MNLAVQSPVDESFTPLAANDSAMARPEWRPLSPNRFEAQVLVKPAGWDLYRTMIVGAWKTQYRYFAEWIPQQPMNRYSVEKTPLMCNVFVRCTIPPVAPVLGIGRTAGTPYIVLVLMAAFGTASMIMMCTSWEPGGAARPSTGILRVRSRSAYVALISGLLSVGFAADNLTLMIRDAWPVLAFGVAPEELFEETPVVSTTYLLYVLPTCYVMICVSIVGTFRFACIDFIRPDFCVGSLFQVVGVLRSLFYYILWVTTLPSLVFVFFVHPNGRFTGSLLDQVGDYVMPAACDVMIFFYLAFSGPNFGMLLPLIMYLQLTIYSFYFWGDSTGSCITYWSIYTFPQAWFRLVFLVLAMFTPYARDRQFVTALGCLFNQSIRIGERIPMYIRRTKSTDMITYDPLMDTLIRTFAVWVIAVICILLMRYQRSLPPQLQGAKYVRLSHLLKMRREGHLLTRCQDVPDTALGDPAKALVLIIVSHRWIDRYTCDVTTPAHPGGFRLTTMCQRFEKLYPQDWKSCLLLLKAGAINVINLVVGSAAHSSHDVLIFFDFLALPQKGRATDGTIIERTPEEEALFHSMLPSMGALYTMYRVLVCPEVPEGVESYSMSGWCFCEYAEASLNDRLLDDGSGFDYDGCDFELPAFKPGVTNYEHMYQQKFESLLAKKNFFFEEDREIVRKIVKGTMTVRILNEAVRQQCVHKVQSCLMQLSEYGVADAIHHAVDADSLDTPLHIAMSLPSQNIVDLLIQFGADPECLNFRGDKPGQYFMVPVKWWPCS